MTFFIGAKNLTGQVIVAEIIEAKDFVAAVNELSKRAEKEVGRFNFRMTAVNEYVDFGKPSGVAEFLEGASAR